ncbi:glycosyltransferase 87 family protein [Streptomyces gilvosporeus]|uniref:glycosyltransferase 87 family protein n=1 Tax=Streptomyces gilvosporeus TaxID=553510 RepID=UPI001F012EA1|nr:glycosyltransferase 87 family protein [Streptomyces gilvosporeus]
MLIRNGEKKTAAATVWRTVQGWDRRLVWGGGWLLAAGFAATLALSTRLETHRSWGLCAGVGYVGAALVGCLLPRPRARSVALGCALTGAVALPLLYLVLTGRAQSEVGVIERSGLLLISQGTPYLPHPQNVAEYTPYLPGMAVFGVPRALLGDGNGVTQLLGDARLWCAAMFLLCLQAGRVVLRRRTWGGPGHSPGHGARYRMAMTALVASPVVAMPLCVSGVDLPLTGLCGLGLALAVRRRPLAAGLVLAVACSLKWTALPAVAVAVAVLAAAGGARPALRCAGASLAGTLVLVLPGALLSPAAMVEQVLAFPTGQGAVRTPADSPLPGHLIAELVPGGWYVTVGLLLLGAVAVTVSLVLRPPSGIVAAVDRLSAGLSVAFLLAPAGRFGYLALPLVLMVWARWADGARRPRTVARSAVLCDPLPRVRAASTRP